MKIVQSRKFVGEPAVEVCCVGEELLKKNLREPKQELHDSLVQTCQGSQSHTSSQEHKTQLQRECARRSQISGSS